LLFIINSIILIGRNRIHTLHSGEEGCGHKDDSPALPAKMGFLWQVFSASIESGVVLNIILKRIFSKSFLHLLASFLILNNKERFLNN
jgi:hypothetical protein